MTPQPSPAMRRLPPGPPPVAIGLAEPEEFPLSFWQRLRGLAAKVRLVWPLRPR